MARIVKEEEFSAKRNQIMDVAQRLIYTKGYEQMSIQDILDTLNMSKGAFYHYFASKPDLIEAVTDRMIAESMQFLNAIAYAPDLSGIEKLHNYFDTVERWKTARKSFLLALLRVWYNDNNLVLRHKLTTRSVQLIAPLITLMIRQGVSEGSFNTPYPDQVAEVVMSLIISMGDTMTSLILGSEKVTDQTEQDRVVQQIEDLIAMYSDALERVLGSAPGSLKIVDIELLRGWMFSADEASHLSDSPQPDEAAPILQGE
jgi:AcrR family transcriptional regulator